MQIEDNRVHSCDALAQTNDGFKLADGDGDDAAVAHLGAVLGADGDELVAQGFAGVDSETR